MSTPATQVPALLLRANPCPRQLRDAPSPIGNPPPGLLEGEGELFLVTYEYQDISETVEDYTTLGVFVRAASEEDARAAALVRHNNWPRAMMMRVFPCDPSNPIVISAVRIERPRARAEPRVT